MKTLMESLFGDNITNNINATTVEDAEKVVVAELEHALKMKCLNVATSSTAEQSVIWKKDKWTLAMYPMSADRQMVSTNIYLQYNLDWPIHIKPGEKIETSTFSIKFIIRISPWRDNQVILKDIGAEVFSGVNYEAGTQILDITIPHYSRLKNVIFNTNTQDIVKFLGECFAKFKFDVEEEVFNEVFLHLYCKHIYKRQTSRKHDELAAHELSRLFNKIIK